MNTSAWHPMSNGMVERLNKNMNQGLSHYVNAADILPFYLMAYGATPHGSTRYSPFFLLHGREMILSNFQNLRTKLAPDVREAEHEPRLENLKSALRSGWAGQHRIVARLSRLHYRIINQQGKDSVVHVNRTERAYKQGIWKPKKRVRCYRKQRTRRQEPEEDESAVLAPGPMSIHAPQDENRQPGYRSPNRNSPRVLDTPATEQHYLDGPGSQRGDPDHVPPDTPRSRRELGTTRPDPPVTRLRSRLQALHEAPDQDKDQESEQLGE